MGSPLKCDQSGDPISLGTDYALASRILASVKNAAEHFGHWTHQSMSNVRKRGFAKTAQMPCNAVANVLQLFFKNGVWSPNDSNRTYRRELKTGVPQIGKPLPRILHDTALLSDGVSYNFLYKTALSKKTGIIRLTFYPQSITTIPMCRPNLSLPSTCGLTKRSCLFIRGTAQPQNNYEQTKPALS